MNPPRILALGLAVFFCANLGFVYVWTTETPAQDLVLLILASGMGVGMILSATSMVSTAPLEIRYQQEAVTSYYFIRQFGSSLGVTAAAVIIDRRMTFHSARILDHANRMDPAVQSLLRTFREVIAERGGGASIPEPGNLELFRAMVVTQTRVLAFIDISYCLAAMALMGLALLGIMRWRQRRERASGVQAARVIS